MEIEQLLEKLIDSYRGSVTMSDVRTVKEHYRSGDIREIVLVGEDEDFLRAVPVIAWTPSFHHGGIVKLEPTTSVAERLGRQPSVTGAEHVYEMARAGVFVLVHERDRAGCLPSRWAPFIRPLGGLRDEMPCRSIMEPPLCYIQYAAASAELS